MGTTITITDVDAITLQRLQAEARCRGIDVNTLAREVLRQAVPPTQSPAPTKTHHDLDSLAGTWSEADSREFEAAVEGFGRTDPELWSDSRPARHQCLRRV